MAADLGTDELGEGSDPDPAERTAGEIRAAGGQAESCCADVATFDGAARVVSATAAAFGQVDIAVNCAGAAIEGSIFEMDEADFHKTIALQLSQKWFVARNVVPQMVAQGWGRIINTTSHGALGDLGQPAFAAAMGGVISLTKALATETAGTGVTANCLAPGAATRLWAKSRADFEAWREAGVIDEEMWLSYVETPPAEFVAPVVVWLCGDEAGYVSGEVVGAAGRRVSVWSGFEEARVLWRGGGGAGAEDATGTEAEASAHGDPWTLDELDQLIPQTLLPRPG